MDLDATRQSGWGPSPISYDAIEAYQRTMHVSMEPWEVRAIRSIDNAILGEIAKESKADG